MRALCFLGLVCSLATAQDDAIFRSQTTLATLHFHVIQKDHYVVDLKPENIVLLEDGVPRPFTVFENTARATTGTPVELTLLFDTSGSVMDKGLLDPLVFRESLLNSLPNVKLAVYGFGSSMTKYCGPTRDFDTLQAAMQSLGIRGSGESIALQLPPKRKANARGATWLYEAVAAVSREAAATPGEAARLIMVFSDGLPSTTSRPEDAAELDRELGIPVYPLLLGHLGLVRRFEEAQRNQKPPKVSKKSGAEMPSVPSQKLMNMQNQLSQVADFAHLGELTGGRSFDPPQIDLSIMKQILTGMVMEVETQYTVGFPVDMAANPRKHRLEVKLTDKDLGRIKGGTRSVVH
jgi:VWFA-related protein